MRQTSAFRASLVGVCTALACGVRFEDSLVYNEPPDWHYPVRHTLGAVLLEAPIDGGLCY